MILKNRSSHPDHEIRELARFVAQFFRAHKNCEVFVYDEDGWDGYGHGLYSPKNNHALVYIPKRSSYPAAAQHRKRNGATTYQCWQDFFVAILAHELRHCDQSHGYASTRFKEVDAEDYAQKVLLERRKMIEGVDAFVRV